MTDWRDALFSRRTLGVRSGLDPLRAVDEALGSPARKARRIQVLGTNGKGSTAAMLSHLLSQGGRRVGLFTSPHLHRVGERVQVNGVAVADDAIRGAVERVLAAEDVAGRQLTFFELLTMAAWCIFEEHDVQDVVLEAGLGGRLDATSLRPCALHLLTSIALDHQSYLGDSLEAIAAEKTGAFHTDGTCLALSPKPEVRAVVEQAAKDTGEGLRWSTRRVASPLPGSHQNLNAALAWDAASALGVNPKAAPMCWEGFVWPGRAERFKVEGGGEIIFDVAHNLAAIDALATSVETGSLPRPDFIIFGGMGDKPIEEIGARLGQLSTPIWWAPPKREGAGQWSRSSSAAGNFESCEDAGLLESLDRATEAGKCALVCGSHFVVAPIRAHVLGISAVDIDATELTDPVLRTP